MVRKEGTRLNVNGRHNGIIPLRRDDFAGWLAVSTAEKEKPRHAGAFR
jgi:hypothetical protein